MPHTVLRLSCAPFSLFSEIILKAQAATVPSLLLTSDANRTRFFFNPCDSLSGSNFELNLIFLFSHAALQCSHISFSFLLSQLTRPSVSRHAIASAAISLYCLAAPETFRS